VAGFWHKGISPEGKKGKKKFKKPNHLPRKRPPGKLPKGVNPKALNKGRAGQKVRHEWFQPDERFRQGGLTSKLGAQVKSKKTALRRRVQRGSRGISRGQRG